MRIVALARKRRLHYHHIATSTAKRHYCSSYGGAAYAASNNPLDSLYPSSSGGAAASSTGGGNEVSFTSGSSLMREKDRGIGQVSFSSGFASIVAQNLRFLPQDVANKYYNEVENRCWVCGEMDGTWSGHICFTQHNARVHVAERAMSGKAGPLSTVRAHWWQMLSAKCNEKVECYRIGALSHDDAKIRRHRLRKNLNFLKEVGVIKHSLGKMDGEMAHTFQFEWCEMLGDNVMKCYFFDRLAAMFPVEEGGLTGGLLAVQQQIDSNDGLERIYDFLELDEIIGQELTKGSKFKADVIEALFGELQVCIWAYECRDLGIETHFLPHNSELHYLYALLVHVLEEICHCVAYWAVAGSVDNGYEMMVKHAKLVYPEMPITKYSFSPSLASTRNAPVSSVIGGGGGRMGSFAPLHLLENSNGQRFNGSTVRQTIVSSQLRANVTLSGEMPINVCCPFVIAQTPSPTAATTTRTTDEDEDGEEVACSPSSLPQHLLDPAYSGLPLRWWRRMRPSQTTLREAITGQCPMLPDEEASAAAKAAGIVDSKTADLTLHLSRFASLDRNDVADDEVAAAWFAEEHGGRSRTDDEIREIKNERRVWAETEKQKRLVPTCHFPLLSTTPQQRQKISVASSKQQQQQEIAKGPRPSRAVIEGAAASCTAKLKPGLTRIPRCGPTHMHVIEDQSIIHPHKQQQKLPAASLLSTTRKSVGSEGDDGKSTAAASDASSSSPTATGTATPATMEEGETTYAHIIGAAMHPKLYDSRTANSGFGYHPDFRFVAPGSANMTFSGVLAAAESSFGVEKKDAGVTLCDPSFRLVAESKGQKKTRKHA